MSFYVTEVNKELLAKYDSLEEAMSYQLPRPNSGFIYDEDGNLLYSRVKAWVEWHDYGWMSGYRYGWQQTGELSAVIWDKEQL